MFYIFLFLALLGTGIGLFPIPEDLIILGAGVGLFEGEGEILPVFLVVLIGILISDSIIFYLGRKLGVRIFNLKFLSFIFPREKTERIKKLFDDHNWKIVFAGRFAAGFRPVVLFTAGLSFKISYFFFLFIDFLASLVYIPLLVFFGYRFSYNIDRWIHNTPKIYHIIEIAIIAAIVVWFIFRLSKKIFNNGVVDKNNLLE
ncbi:MAG: DedA family protein [Candidatus Terrybacteria bacterium]|nr:DedA family protein [Candidatus Terrybacteria bacterium]